MGYLQDINELSDLIEGDYEEKISDDEEKRFNSFFKAIQKVAKDFGKEECLVINRCRETIFNEWTYLFS